MKLKLKEQLLGFLFLAPIFVAIPVACLEHAQAPPAEVSAPAIIAPLNLKAVVDAERAEESEAEEATADPRSDPR
jgi:hypothetical protein